MHHVPRGFTLHSHGLVAEGRFHPNTGTRRATRPASTERGAWCPIYFPTKPGMVPTSTGKLYMPHATVEEVEPQEEKEQEGQLSTIVEE